MLLVESVSAIERSRSIRAVVSAASAVEQSRSTRSRARSTRARSAACRALADRMRQQAEAIKRSTALRILALKGGAGSGRSEAEVRARLVELIDEGRLPARPPRSIWAGRSHGGRKCTACQTALNAGETEYELGGAGGSDGSDGHKSLIFHRRCIELWAEEAERRSD